MEFVGTKEELAKRPSNSERLVNRRITSKRTLQDAVGTAMAAISPIRPDEYSAERIAPPSVGEQGP
jgi:hypothetical protein